MAFPHPENVKNIWNVFGKLQVFSEHHRFVCMNGFSKTFLNKSHIFYHKKKQCLNIVGESLRRGEKFIDLLVRPNFTEYFFLSHHFTWVICFFVFFSWGGGGDLFEKKRINWPLIFEKGCVSEPQKCKKYLKCFWKIASVFGTS